MLVLHRKPGEAITIGDDVVIEVVRVTANNVYIGITAPKSVKILRAELEREVEDE